ncbi:hypothetical protein LINGRAHAP2_LOCUS1660 [Linum grandiflorum]
MSSIINRCIETSVEGIRETNSGRRFQSFLTNDPAAFGLKGPCSVKAPPPTEEQPGPDTIYGLTILSDDSILL